MTMPSRILTVTCVLALSPSAAHAATYTVGPPCSGAQYTQLDDVFEQRNLAPGDIVSVRGGLWWCRTACFIMCLSMPSMMARII